MKIKRVSLNLLAMAAILLIASCESPIKITTWKNMADNSKISKVVIMPLFEKLEFMKPFEQSMSSYFISKGLKSIGSLEFLNPNIKYPIADIKRKCDSLGADAILVFIYQGTDKTESYIPGTTYVTGGFGGYWGNGYWGGGYYGPAYYGSTVTTAGSWTVTKVVNLKASVYSHVSKDPLWTAEISVTDPQYVDQASAEIAHHIYADWERNNILKQQGK